MIKDIIREMVPDFSWVKLPTNFRREFVVGFIGAILTIPQAITFSYLAGLPPEYGLYCAIYTTLIASLLGSSMMVGGPNAAVSMLLGVAVLPFAGAGSPLFINFILILSFMVGIVELILWLSRASRILQYFSLVLINAITTGVGVLIVFYSLDGIIGTTGIRVNFFYEKLYIMFTAWDGIANNYAFVVGIITIATGLWVKRKSPRYYILAALFAGTSAGFIINGIYGVPHTELDLLGHTPLKLLDFRAITLDWEYLSVYIQLAGASVVIALIAISQAMIMINELKIDAELPVNANKDIYAQGVANVSGVFFGAFCGGGSFNRTRLNRTLGSRTKLATIFSCFIMIALVNFFSDIIAYIPMATMSGLLLLVGLEMIKWQTIKSALQNKIDTVSFFTTLFVVILISLEAGLLLAFILSVLIFIHRIATVEITVFDEDTDKVCAVTIKGCLFFATLDNLLQLFREHTGYDLVLDMRELSYIGLGPAQLIVKEQKKRASGDHSIEILPPEKWCAGFPEMLREIATRQS